MARISGAVLEKGASRRPAEGVSLPNRPAADEPDELTVNGVDNAAPVDTPVIHQAIERVLLVGEQLAKGAVGIVHRLSQRIRSHSSLRKRIE